MSADDLILQDELTFEADLEHPPEQVWRALTQPDLLSAWLPEGPDVSRALVEADPPNVVRYAWRDAAGDPPLESEVTFVLRPSPGGTHLTVIHGGLSVRQPLPANSNTAAWSLKCAA